MLVKLAAALAAKFLLLSHFCKYYKVFHLMSYKITTVVGRAAVVLVPFYGVI